ncbi:hypothetical protein HK102_003463, partial [Quaeritorhiza haematococci]
MEARSVRSERSGLGDLASRFALEGVGGAGEGSGGVVGRIEAAAGVRPPSMHIHMSGSPSSTPGYILHEQDSLIMRERDMELAMGTFSDSDEFEVLDDGTTRRRDDVANGDTRRLSSGTREQPRRSRDTANNPTDNTNASRSNSVRSARTNRSRRASSSKEEYQGEGTGSKELAKRAKAFQKKFPPVVEVHGSHSDTGRLNLMPLGRRGVEDDDWLTSTSNTLTAESNKFSVPGYVEGIIVRQGVNVHFRRKVELSCTADHPLIPHSNAALNTASIPRRVLSPTDSPLRPTPIPRPLSFSLGLTNNTTKTSHLASPRPTVLGEFGYFEVLISRQKDTRRRISIGLSTNPYPAFRLPGRHPHSIALDSVGVLYSCFGPDAGEAVEKVEEEKRRRTEELG